MRLIYLSIWCYPKRGRKSLNPWAAFPLVATYSHRPSDLTRRRSIYFRCTLAAMRWTRKISAKVLGCADAITSHCVSALVFYDLIQRLRMAISSLKQIKEALYAYCRAVQRSHSRCFGGREVDRPDPARDLQR